ncbi:MAG: MerR family transcriptional regulator [Bacteroidales bacterium]|nr:MerR family transcriptional regulator [Bacteroidales bacterium]
MPYKEQPVEKIFFTIGEVAQMLQVSTTQIRFWEKNFKKYIRPRKTPRGNRLFSQADVENLKLIRHLLKEQLYTIEGAKKRMDEGRQALADNYAMIESLNRIRAMLLEIRDEL